MPDIPINEFVVPVVEAVPDEPYARITRFRGTGFMFGPRGAVCTAEHVVRTPADELAIATPNRDGGFRLWSLQGVEAHATEDVAVGIVSLGDSLPESPLRMTDDPQYGSASWMLWGYPEDVMRDRVVDGVAGEHPELVFVNGYIRRRMPSDIDVPQVRGRALYECGGLAGRGCSGAPVIRTDQVRAGYWPVVGVYVGQRIAADRGMFVSYAVRLDDVADWIPTVLGQSLAAESAP
jgi:hypothetical protein